MESQPDPNESPSSTNLGNPPIIPPKPSIFKQFFNLKPSTLVILGSGAFLVLLLLIMLIGFIAASSNKISNEKQAKIEADQVEKERLRQLEASQAAAKRKNPINQLQKAYDGVVGTNTSKRNLTIDSNGTAIVEYEISSTDGQIILKTSYENFAELAKRVFNIETIKRLNVTTYANKFTDKFGKPNVFAVKTQVTKETNEKINWSVKKYSYIDYATILDLHELNTDLTKDYKSLTKSKS